MALIRTERRRSARTRDSPPSGLGQTANITVQGARATAQQRTIIDGCLAEAARLGASRRVMVAVVMCITQESGAGRLMNVMTGNDDVGIFQQGRNWISLTGSKDPASSTRAFLLGHEANVGGTDRVLGWKQKHGSLKNAPGDLDVAITAVQISVGGYGKWQAEAERTVAAWSGSEDGLTSGGGETTVSKRYEFTRGARNGERETSWDAMDRLAQEVPGFRRWAAANTLHYASEDEMRAAAPSVQIDGDEAWVLSQPQWEWGSGREVSEVTLRVLADRWHVLPGGVVMLGGPEPVVGRWLVKSVSGARLDSPEADVVLKRPSRHAPEPAAEQASDSSPSSSPSADTAGAPGGGTGEGVDAVYETARAISNEGMPYVWGGGHARAGTPDGGVPGGTGGGIGLTGYDCSGYVAACLLAANMGYRKGESVPASGTMATSWGKPGKGREMTMWANGEHVWLEFHGDGRDGHRADTSPQGDGPAGGRLRTRRRSDQVRFTARHWS